MFSEGSSYSSELKDKMQFSPLFVELDTQELLILYFLLWEANSCS